MPDPWSSSDPAERLLEDFWEAREQRASRRELCSEFAAAALFLAAAGGLLALPHATAGFAPAVAALLVALYVLVARVEFPVGTGHVVPTQLVLVPMLVLLPPATVPALAAGGLVVGALWDWARGRGRPERLLFSLSDAWHAIGPAGVLLLAGSPRIGFDDAPLMAAALAAGGLVDLASAMLREAASRGVAPSLQLRVIVPVWAVDACLAPIGMLAAVATDHGLGAVLLVLPLGGLLLLLARDRSARIAQAHRRLELVKHERSRLQTAVRRMGDAFAAKLDLDALLTITLRGSLEALDADAGRLTLSAAGTTRELESGDAAHRGAALRAAAEAAAAANSAQQLDHHDGWVLALPLRAADAASDLRGVLCLARRARAFQADEIALVTELVEKACVAATDILALHELRAQATTDPLTGLGNRRQLAADFSSWRRREADCGAPTLLMSFDLDGFKAYNDTFGHLAGDALLTRLAGKLTEAVGARGGAYRLGGDEFCALLPVDVDELDDVIGGAADALTERGDEFTIGASCGVVVLPREADNLERALQLADERMYARKHSRGSGARDQARDVLMRTMQAKQPALDEHSDEVAQLAVRVARRLGLAGEQLDEIARAAELHDIGKVGIPDAILNKPGPLSPDEWEFMRQHTILGERILNAAPALRPVARLVRSTHERWDGHGYPDRLAGAQIPFGARIVAVCDAYQAMTADRTYRAAPGHAHARRELRANAGSQFDPTVITAFLAEIDGDTPTADARAADAARRHGLIAQVHELLNDTAAIAPPG